MDSFKTKILSFLFGMHRLCVVKDSDGFLSRSDVQKWLSEANVVIEQGSQFQLRLMFELRYNTDKDSRYCFVADDSFQVLPDIRQCSNIVSFNLSDFFPAYHKPYMISAPLDVMEKLYGKVQVKTLNMRETEILVSQLEEQKDPMDEILRTLLEISGNNLEEKLFEVGECIVESLERDAYDKIEKEIDRINSEWQNGLEDRYFGQILSSFLSAPSYVGNVLNHIYTKYKNDKVALVVVDGMSFWQYLILKKSLPSTLDIQDSFIYSWIPSITMLSRQAIFKGGRPSRDYRQNPQNEKKLWFEYWRNHDFMDEEIGYEYNHLEENSGIAKRLAYVTAKLDDKMHASENNRDLFSLTKNWATSFVNDIDCLIADGYKLFLTTDHGNVETNGWRKLTSQEKVYLYGDGSRGMRHLIYKDTHGMNELYNQMEPEQVWRHDDWIVWRNRKSFLSNRDQVITHGGCHFLEVLVPFVKISRNLVNYE